MNNLEFIPMRQFIEAHDGEGIWVWQQGRDCDGMSYGHPRYIKCKNRAELETYINECYEWADGPMFFSIISQDELERHNESL